MDKATLYIKHVDVVLVADIDPAGFLAFHSVRDLLGEELLSRQRVISFIGTGAVVIFCESASHP